MRRKKKNKRKTSIRRNKAKERGTTNVHEVRLERRRCGRLICIMTV